MGGCKDVVLRRKETHHHQQKGGHIRGNGPV